MDGLRLKKVRKERGYTQVSLAEALGVSKGSVAMWETGKRNPEFETLEQLLSILDVSYDYLTGKTDSEEYHNPTDEDIEQMGIWETEYRYTDLFKLFFALDEYGQNDVEALIHSQLQRCREQGTTKKTDHITVNVGIRKTEY